MCCSFLEDKVHKICAINTNDGKGKIFKSSYVSCLSTGDSETFDRRNITNISSNMWGLALPIKQEKNKKYLYLVTTDTWKERFYDKKLKTASYILPRVDKCKY